MCSMRMLITPPVTKGDNTEEEEPQTYKMTITVTDGTDPVKGASVTIDESSETTDDDGKVEFDLAYGDYEATVEATGYDDSTEELSFRSNHKNFTITLTANGG